LTKRVLFVCVENAGRSKMAEAFARINGMIASSAGTKPSEEVNPTVTEAMKERGITLQDRPRMLTEQMIREADLVVTMGCSVEAVCPRSIVQEMKKKLVDWHIEDPKGKTLEEVRKIRSQIENKVTELSNTNHTGANKKDECSPQVTIDNARQDDLKDILELLDQCELPREGLTDLTATILVARNGNEIVGCSALELYPNNALLRSVAIKPSFQNRGLGKRLVKATLDLAVDNKISNLYLLTETASTFFSKLGFENVPRSAVPENVRRSLEFTTLCPNTAKVMTMILLQDVRRGRVLGASGGV
jgi:protein-tyrosine-phosphatase/N-acetylglutamate synthase-like GNAT family acetyltransferase